MYGCSIFSNSSVALPGLWASIGVTHSTLAARSYALLTDDVAIETSVHQIVF